MGAWKTLLESSLSVETAPRHSPTHSPDHLLTESEGLMTTQRHWYNDRDVFLHGLVRSNYVTAITDWFLSFAGKWTELVLYATVLYSSAQLYPGVHLPVGLSLAVFLIQMGALDIGGLSLAKMARQAREDGNTDGAQQAEALSRWLIGIMLIGVVTVGIEHVIPIPAQVQIGVEITLVVARSICSVLYGRVVHLLKSEAVQIQRIPVVDVQHHLQAVAEQLQQIERRFTEIHHQQLTETVQTIERDFQEYLSERLSAIVATLQLQSETLSLLPTFNEQFDHLRSVAQYQIRTTEEVLQLKAALEHISSFPHPETKPGVASTSRTRVKPPLQFVPSGSERKPSGEFDKAQFVYACLKEEPSMRITDIQQRAAERGQSISVGSVSQYRKSFFESVKAAENKDSLETEAVAIGQ